MLVTLPYLSSETVKPHAEVQLYQGDWLCQVGFWEEKKWTRKGEISETKIILERACLLYYLFNAYLGTLSVSQATQRR